MTFITNLKRSLKNKGGVKLQSLGLLILSQAISFDASAAGLQKVRGLLDMMKNEILTIVPILAVLSLILMGIGYMMKLVNRDTFIRWMVGLVIVGSAAQITSLFLN